MSLIRICDSKLWTLVCADWICRLLPSQTYTTPNVLLTSFAGNTLGSVITGEEDQSVLFNVQLFEFSQYNPHTVVYFHH